MNFSAWAIRQPIPSILLFVVLSLAGIIGFRALPIQNQPDLDLPTVIVNAALPGATPSSLETEVTRKIEDSVATLTGVSHITSTVNDGVSVTRIEFVLEKDVQEAVNDVRNAVDSIRSNLPADLRSPVVSRVTTSGGAILTFAVRSDSLDVADLSWFVDNDLNKALFSVPGVGRVTRLGGMEREIRVELDPARLLALNITAGEISAQIRRVQQEAPGGRAALGNQEQSIRTLGTVADVEGIAGLTIPLNDGRRIRLDAVATVTDTAAETRQLALLNGKPVVSFQVVRSRGYGEVEVAERVRERLILLTREHPQVSFEEINNSIKNIRSNYEAAMQSLFEGALLAVIVVWIFLRDWRATFVSAVALPLSIVPTFAAMSLLGFGLNTITLLALTLIVGVLVDDAIVEVENIVRHLRSGKPPKEAALEAANEIGLAVIATSMTLVAVFLPTAFMGGIPGLFFKQFGWTTAIAVLMSLLVARLLTPMMAAYLLKPKGGEEQDGRIMQVYLRAVRACLNHPGKTMVASGLFFVGSMSLVGLLSTTFLVAEDQDQFSVSVEAPPGSTIDQTLALAEQVRAILAANPEVVNVFTSLGTGTSGGLGGGGGAAAEVRRATLSARLTPADERKRSQQQIEGAVRERLVTIAGARVAISGAGPGQRLSLVLSGDDQRLLLETARQVMTELRTLPNLGNITSSASLLRPEIIVRPDFARAAELGVSAPAIGEAVRIATTGDYDTNLPRLNLPARQLYIRTRLDAASRTDLETIKRLRVAARGGTVPLGNVAEVSIAGGPAQIDRYDRSRNVTIDIELRGRALGDVTEEVSALASLANLPGGIRRIEAGEAERLKELFGGFGIAMAAGVLCIYIVLVLLFHDFLQPITILTALPLSVGGAFGMLVLFGFSLSLSALIGLVMLMGIVTKNSILLVEYAIMARREQGLTRTAAIIDACHKRAQPIVMTTIAMVAGMVPMAISGSSFRSPMAVAVIGGLITSTALSLLVVPVVFELVDDAKGWLRRLIPHRG